MAAFLSPKLTEACLLPPQLEEDEVGEYLEGSLPRLPAGLGGLKTQVAVEIEVEVIPFPEAY